MGHLANTVLLKQTALGRGMSLRSYCLEMLECSLGNVFTCPVVHDVRYVDGRPEPMKYEMEELEDEKSVLSRLGSTRTREQFIETLNAERKRKQDAVGAWAIPPPCKECYRALVSVKGKWRCADTGCSMYGLEQKVGGV